MTTYKQFNVVIPCEIVEPDCARQTGRKAELVFEVGAHTYRGALENFTKLFQDYINEKENT